MNQLIYDVCGSDGKSCVYPTADLLQGTNTPNCMQFNFTVALGLTETAQLKGHGVLRRMAEHRITIQGYVLWD